MHAAEFGVKDALRVAGAWSAKVLHGCWPLGLVRSTSGAGSLKAAAMKICELEPLPETCALPTGIWCALIMCLQCGPVSGLGPGGPSHTWSHPWRTPGLKRVKG